jgi:hypothetical protein
VNLSGKEMIAAALAVVLAVTAAVALLDDATRFSLAMIDGLLLLLVAIGIAGLRRQSSWHAGQLERIERKIDNLALRVVTESQATHRELGGLIEELGSSLHDPDQGASA